MVTGRCRLYDTETELMESHIYPKFAIDYLKSTGSRYLRRFVEPNRRMQDGIKLPLLSQKAEQQFSISEKWFAENMFISFQEERANRFDYNEHLFKFSVSFLWRMLLLNLGYVGIDRQPYHSLLLEASEDWKGFLRKGRYPVFDRIYLMLTGPVDAHSTENKGVDYYFTRTLDGTIVSNGDNSFVAVYAKFLRFIFWGVLKGGDDETNKAALRVHPLKGTIVSPQQLSDQHMIEFYFNRIKTFSNMPEASDNQHEKILEEWRKDPQAFFRSDAGRAILNDLYNLDSPLPE